MNNCRVNVKSTLAPTQQSYVDVGGANGYEATTQIIYPHVNRLPQQPKVSTTMAFWLKTTYCRTPIKREQCQSAALETSWHHQPQEYNPGISRRISQITSDSHIYIYIMQTYCTFVYLDYFWALDIAPKSSGIQHGMPKIGRRLVKNSFGIAVDLF